MLARSRQHYSKNSSHLASGDWKSRLRQPPLPPFGRRGAEVALLTYSKPTYALLKPSIFRKSAQAERACIAAISNRQGLVLNRDFVIALVECDRKF
jgi:hypothetical protein